MQTPILQGRNFGSQDRLDSPKVAIINRGMAERLWPGQSALGKSIHCGKDRDFVIIGITPEVPFLGLAQAVGNQVYVSIEQDPPSGLGVLLRAQGEPLTYVESFRRAVISIDPGRAISNVTSVQALADQTIAGQRTSTMVIAVLGALALFCFYRDIWGNGLLGESSRARIRYSDCSWLEPIQDPRASLLQDLSPCPRRNGPGWVLDLRHARLGCIVAWTKP